MYKKVHRFISLSFTEKRLFLEAYVLLLYAKAILLFIPLRKLAGSLGVLNAKIAKELSSEKYHKAQKIKIAILSSSANVPWKSVCIDQAVATVIMLNKRKISNSLVLGVRKNEKNNKLEAHAWIDCGNEILIGGKRSHNYNIIATFANDH